MSRSNANTQALVTLCAAMLLTACSADSTPTAASSSSPSPTPNVVKVTPSPSPSPTPSAVASTPSPVAQTVKLDINQQFPPDNPGSYARVTPTFEVSNDWKIAYSFDCQNAQGFGFVVTVYQGDSPTQTDLLATDAYNVKGSNVVIEHVGGTFHLTVLTAAGCTWRVVVTG